MLMLKM